MADIELSESTVYNNIRIVLVAARQKVYSAVNTAMVEAYWDIGRQIMEAQENKRAEYGTGLLKYLAERLTKEFGKGFTQTNLKYMRQFYEAFPISHTLCDQLSWSHYRLLMKINDASRREFYLAECAECKLKAN
jgi:predicted nuclease of restriction endonuclease-like (RecB) superfamily